MTTRAPIDPHAAERSPARELRDSFMLIALTVSSLSAYVGLGVLVVRLFAAR